MKTKHFGQLVALSALWGASFMLIRIASPVLGPNVHAASGNCRGHPRTGYALMVPLFGVTWGHLFLGEKLGTGMFAGGALVLLASGLITGFNPWQKWLDYVDARV